MGNKKNKKTKRKESWVNTDVEDEKLALQTIFGSECEVNEDDPNRCSLQIVPHEAMLEENHVSVTLHLACVAVSIIFVWIDIIQWYIIEFNGVDAMYLFGVAGFQRNIPKFHFSSSWMHITESLLWN